MNEIKEAKLKIAKEHAIAKGGKCLSEQYKNCDEKLEWKCNHPEHKPFFCSFYNAINNGRWCRECANLKSSLRQKNPKGLEIAKEHAKSKNGYCFSTEYKNGRQKLEWKCSNPEHEPWKARFNTVIHGDKWCPKCGDERTSQKRRNPKGLEIAHEYAKSKNGLCLSSEYTNSYKHLIWKCENENHESWESTFDTIINKGAWCPKCGDERMVNKRKKQDGLEQAKQIAISKNGECLSIEYHGIHKKMIWKCEDETHEPWEASFANVKLKNSWCPICSLKSYSEKRTRIIFEVFFGKSFIKIRPDWNINPWTNSIMELDGYCKEFNVAFEYDGEHHYKITRNLKAKDLTYQKFRDFQKKKNCLERGITLINIPFIDIKLKDNFQAFLSHIIKHCEEQGLPMSFTDQQILELEDRFNKI